MSLVCAAVLAGACGRGDGDESAPRPAECSPSEVVSEGSRAAAVTWARGLTYHPEDSSRGYVTGYDPSGGGILTVNTTGNARTRSRSELGRGCVIGRIISNRVDTALGLAADTNYVWADSLTGRWRTLVFSNTGSGIRSFGMVIHAHAGGRPAPDSAALTDTVRRPCMDCEIAGWCRFPIIGIDSLRATAPGVRPGGPGVRDTIR